MGTDLVSQRHKHRVAGIGNGLDKILIAVILGVHVAAHRLDAGQGVIPLAGKPRILTDDPFLQPDGGGDGLENRARLVKVGDRLVPVLLVAGFDQGRGLLVAGEQRKRAATSGSAMVR